MISLYGESTKNLKLSARGRELMAELQTERGPDYWQYEYWKQQREQWLPVLEDVAKGEDKVIGRGVTGMFGVDVCDDLQEYGYIYKPGTWYGTPGPWLVGAGGNDNVTDIKGRVICGISNNVKRPQVEKQANLRLIARAPVMRLALIELQQWLGSTRGRLEERQFLDPKAETLRIVNAALEGLKGEE